MRPWFIVLALSLVSAACSDDSTPNPMPDAPVNTVDAPPGLCAGGSVAYLGACTDNAECGSCSCQSFGHTRACTIPCTMDTECPAPSGGCSTTAGYCRP